MTQRTAVQDTDPGADGVVFCRSRFDLGSTLLGSSPVLQPIRPLDASEAARRSVAPNDADESDSLPDGIKAYLRSSIRDGVVVLLYSARTFGAVMMSKQRLDETASYRWRSRSDGVGRLDPRDPDVDSGKGAFDIRVKPGLIGFPDFQFSFRPVTEGYGRLLSVSSADCFMCVTSRTSFDGIDARSSEFVYQRASDGSKWGF